MHLFSADAMVFSKKLKKKNFDPKKVKKRASKVAHNWPRPFFPQSSSGHSPQSKIDSPYHEISGPDICSLICEVMQPISNLPLYITLVLLTFLLLVLHVMFDAHNTISCFQDHPKAAACFSHLQGRIKLMHTNLYKL